MQKTALTFLDSQPENQILKKKPHSKYGCGKFENLAVSCSWETPFFV